MTAQPNQPSADLEQLRQQLQAVLELKDHVVLAISQVTGSVSRSVQRQLRSLSDRVAYLEDAQSVIRDPKLLELFSPLAMRGSVLTTADPRTVQAEVEQSVYQVLQRQTKLGEARQEIFSLLMVPLLALLLVCVLGIGLTVFLVPLFESMFLEFELELPASTRLLISLSHLVQSPLFLVVFGCLLVATLLLLLLHVVQYVRWLLGGPAELLLTRGISTRRALGELAWHLALLMDAGLSLESALPVAAESSRQPGMGAMGQPSADQLGWAVEQDAMPVWYCGLPVHLLALGIQFDAALAPTAQAGGIDHHAAQIDFLREVSSIYGEREQSRWIWLLSWVPTVVRLLVVGFVSFLVFSLFGPLIQLISGLA